MIKNVKDYGDKIDLLLTSLNETGIPVDDDLEELLDWRPSGLFCNHFWYYRSNILSALNQDSFDKYLHLRMSLSEGFHVYAVINLCQFYSKRGLYIEAIELLISYEEKVFQYGTGFVSFCYLVHKLIAISNFQVWRVELKSILKKYLEYYPQLKYDFAESCNPKIAKDEFEKFRELDLECLLKDTELAQYSKSDKAIVSDFSIESQAYQEWITDKELWLNPLSSLSNNFNDILYIGSEYNDLHSLLNRYEDLRHLYYESESSQNLLKLELSFLGFYSCFDKVLGFLNSQLVLGVKEHELAYVNKKILKKINKKLNDVELNNDLVTPVLFYAEELIGYDEESAPEFFTLIKSVSDKNTVRSNLIPLVRLKETRNRITHRLSDEDFVELELEIRELARIIKKILIHTVFLFHESEELDSKRGRN